MNQLVLDREGRARTLAQVNERAPLLPFKLKEIGYSFLDVPDSPQVVDENWWVQPVRSPTDLAQLPPRAKQRLAAIVEAGIQPYDLLIYHEIKHPSQLAVAGKQVGRGLEVAGTQTKQSLGAIALRTKSAVATYLTQDLPWQAEQLNKFLKTYGPPFMRGLMFTLGTVLPVLLMVAAFIAVSPLIVLAHDPVLVMVTEDGYWVEIDRWAD